MKFSEAEVQRIEAALEFARAELRRAQVLARTDAIAAKTLDRAKLDVQTNEAALASAKAQLDVRRSERASIAARLIDPLSAIAAPGPTCCVQIRAPVTGRDHGAGVAVVYDSVGKDTFAGSIDSLRRRGLLVCVGTASGPVPPIDATQLAVKGSVYVTRPALADYIADPAEKNALARELFDHVAAGRIRIEINQRYQLQDAAQAHRDLESRKTTGSSVFVV